VYVWVWLPLAVPLGCHTALTRRLSQCRSNQSEQRSEGESTTPSSRKSKQPKEEKLRIKETWLEVLECGALLPVQIDRDFASSPSVSGLNCALELSLSQRALPISICIPCIIVCLNEDACDHVQGVGGILLCRLFHHTAVILVCHHILYQVQSMSSTSLFVDFLAFHQ